MVSPVYLLMRQTMTTSDQGNRGAASTSADRIGMVFVVVGQDVRRCLICEGIVDCRAAF
jgi:hypothetical protein